MWKRAIRHEPSILHHFLVVCQLNNLELVVNLAKRGNLLGAENLVNTLLAINFGWTLIFVFCWILRLRLSAINDSTINQPP